MNLLMVVEGQGNLMVVVVGCETAMVSLLVPRIRRFPFGQRLERLRVLEEDLGLCRPV